MKHLFKATKIGWDKDQEGVWFDSAHYTKEEAKAEFKPYEGTTQRGYSTSLMGKNITMSLISVSLKMTLSQKTTMSISTAC